MCLALSCFMATLKFCHEFVLNLQATFFSSLLFISEREWTITIETYSTYRRQRYCKKESIATFGSLRTENSPSQRDFFKARNIINVTRFCYQQLSLCFSLIIGVLQKHRKASGERCVCVWKSNNKCSVRVKCESIFKKKLQQVSWC